MYYCNLFFFYTTLSLSSLGFRYIMTHQLLAKPSKRGRCHLWFAMLQIRVCLKPYPMASS